MSQEDIFLNGEGDNWFRRNRSSLITDKNDQALELLRIYEISPKRVLDIGCSNGHKLDFINRRYGAECVGIDPSKEAVKDGEKFEGITLLNGTARDIKVQKRFDLIILNFVLSWIDRDKLDSTISEISRLLIPGGYLLIGDFKPEKKYINDYKHLPKGQLNTYKQDYSELFISKDYYLVGCLTSSHTGKGFIDEIDPDERVGYYLIRRKL